jgi:chromosome segregation ATPase
MSRTDDIFRPALAGKKIPIISLDNKWYKLMAGIEHTPEMKELEDKLKELLKRQGKINSELKEIKKQKAKLMEDIVGVMDSENGDEKQEEYKKKIDECNARMDKYQDELLDLPKEINEVNMELMLDTMEICYEVIQENTDKIKEIADWITNVRIELKKNVVRKQECELKNQQMYSYMHDIFGAEVIDIFDMKYNPEENPLKA